jgi:ribonucleoside-diphosphate reductase alpha chain
MGRVRAIGDMIRNGEVLHTGVIPFLKVMEASVKSCQQNGIRGGSATVHFPIWHKEIEDIMVLKNNKGTEENRVRKLDYSIQINKLFYKRFQQKANISLFSPNDVLDLQEVFYSGDNDKFEELYVKYENDNTISKKVISSVDLFSSLAQERSSTGRLYVMNIDNVNNHSSFDNTVSQGVVTQSNLCQEITLPTKSNQSLSSDEGEIAICVLCAINVGIIKTFSDLKQICENAVRSLDSIIDIQDYPVKSAEKMLKRRSIGIGITNFAYLLAKNKLKYGTSECLLFVDELMEHIQYYCLQASIELAKEKGKCEYFEYTKYSKGILPIDTYNKNVDKLVTRPYTLDWEQLRSDIKAHGLRNSTLTTIMPCESSGLVSNSTNSIEPVRQLLTNKKSKQGVIKQLVPEVNKLQKYYQLAFDIENSDINKTVAVIQKYIDQAISVNHYYNPKKFENGLIPVSSIVKDILEFYSYGGKNLYYANTSDGKTDNFDTLNNSVYNVKEVVKEELPIEEQYDMSGCDGGACSI